MNFAEDDDPGDSGDHHNDFDIHQNTEIHVKGETTLDNGVTVGVHWELEGDESSDQIDEAYGYFSGGFGEVRFGSDDEASLQTCVEIGRATSELQSLMRISSSVFCLKKKIKYNDKYYNRPIPIISE